MIYQCCSEARKSAILGNSTITLNGIDYLELQDQQTLLVHCLRWIQSEQWVDIERLREDPARSNRSIADELGCNEGSVRRQRCVLELAGFLVAADIRTGSNGVSQRRVLAS